MGKFFVEDDLVIETDKDKDIDLDDTAGIGKGFYQCEKNVCSGQHKAALDILIPSVGLGSED